MSKQKSASRMFQPDFFKALGDPNRIALLLGLTCGPAPQNVHAMSKCCSVDLSVVSRHLAQLRKAGILIAEKRGKEMRYSVNAKEVARAFRNLAGFFESCCSPQRKTRRQIK
jgi:DNA-binding transcriptional ArsR family regulator